MARIELRAVAHSYVRRPEADEDYAVKPLDLVWNDGGSYALLGPSGCGKTTLLSIISGLLRPSAGTIFINGVDVTASPPERRGVAQVFQFPVIYDTMTVFDNLAFPLKNRGMGAREAAVRVEEIAALLDLTGELQRKASGLGADMKQKISLGRGLVRKDVAAILLDEPLTVIDPHVKWLLRRKLKQIHEELRVTLVCVTHDQVEALTLADEVVVMNGGRVVQQGSPQALFERPEHTFVGYFIGSPGMNLLPCAVDLEGPRPAAVVEGQRIAFDGGVCARARDAGGELLLGARPEFLRLARAEPADEPCARVTLVEVENLGRHQIATVRLGERLVKVKLSEDERAPVGEVVWLVFTPARTTLYAGGRAVA